MNLVQWYRIVYRVINRKLHPIKFARKIGVNFKGGTYLRKCRLVY